MVCNADSWTSRAAAQVWMRLPGIPADQALDGCQRRNSALVDRQLRFGREGIVPLDAECRPRTAP